MRYLGISLRIPWEQGLQEALNRRPQPERLQHHKLDGEAEAHLVAHILVAHGLVVQTV